MGFKCFEQTTRANGETTPWLNIIGIGEDGIDGLSVEALDLLENAEIIIGGKRHHALLPDLEAERLFWPSPFDAMIETFKSYQEKRIAVLVTGDPLWYSLGARLLKFFPANEIRFFPQLSSFQWAASRLGWSLADLDTLTVHGRPVEQIIAFLSPGRRLLVLTRDGDSPKEIAAILREQGFGDSKMYVLSHLGGKQEKRFDGIAKNWARNWRKKMPDFHVLAIECVSDENAQNFSRQAGLPDEAFEHDGQLTKRSLRAATLARLRPYSDALLWDIGAGCGSVAIEWMRGAREARAIAIESNQKRIKLIEKNAQKLGAPRLQIINGEAPQALENLDKPDAIFIGGGIATKGLFNMAWKALKPGGRMVVNVVTLESEQKLFELFQKHGGEIERIAVSKLEGIGKQARLSGFKPAMTVTQWVVQKPFPGVVQKPFSPSRRKSS